MKPKIVTGWTAVLAVLVATGPLLAHHSVGVFETTTPISEGHRRTVCLGQSPLRHHRGTADGARRDDPLGLGKLSADFPARTQGFQQGFVQTRGCHRGVRLRAQGSFQLSHGSLESGEDESQSRLAGGCRQGHHCTVVADAAWSRGALVALRTLGIVHK